MVLNEHFITLHDINNLSVSKICQLSKAKQKQSNLIITPNEEYFGFVLDDQICFQSLFNYIEMTYYQKFNNKILYNSFSADNKLFYIIDQKSNFIQIDLNSKKKIEDNLEFGYINILTLNWQGTEAIFNRSNSQLESNKLLLADIKAKKEVQIIENIHIDIEYRKIIFSADEKNFMTGYQDQTIKYWDKKSCKLLYLFKSNKQIQQIQLSSQGILAQTGQDKILLWNLKVVKQEKVQMDGHSKQITILLISPDGLQLIARSDDLLSRWDLLEMKRLNFEINESKIPYKFCFSQDSQYLAAVDWYAFYLWKFNSKHMIGRYCKLYFDCLFNFEFNRLNNSLIFTKNELIIKWDVQKIENLNIQPFIQDQSQCFCEFIFSSCAESYVSTNPLQIVYIDDKGQQQFQKLKLNQDIKVGVIALSQDCKRLALVNQINNSIILLEVENNQQKLLIDEECSNTKILSMTFSENDKLLFSCHEDDKLRLWDVQDKFILIQKINAPYQCVFTEPFGVAYCQTIRTFPEKNDEFLIFWAATVNCYSDWAYEMNVYYYLKGEKKVLKDAGHQDAESLSAAYSSQKQLLAIQRIRNLQIYNLGSNELILNIKCDEAYKNNISTLLSFSPDGNILLGLSENNRINYWDLTDNQIIKLKWNLNQIVKANAIVYVPTKNVIRILGQDNMIYDLHKTEFVEMCQISKIKTEIKVNNEKKQYQSQNYTISFNEKQLEIFERKTQQLKYTLDSFFSGIRCLSESPCGFQFFLGMQDGSILCYKIEEELLNKYTKPVCYKVISNIPFFYAELCNINNSKFYSKDNENLNRLFIQKGAIEQKEAI
ncbi:unnamed protein product [Paramecium sonneborni]|uniref:WD40-repeat-containing domain n=1 Tax=Paramecium sonneborni TaxID=65129 RepID=A0A8S1R3V7_9CILI|nr:unnamed protein product [Paramecium sonneborni]